MRIVVEERDGPRREAGSEQVLKDGAGQYHAATVVAETSLTAEVVRYELEVSADSELAEVAFVAAADYTEDGQLRCPKIILVGAAARQCRFPLGHYEPHQP
ncbi:hypothetical protein LRS13_13795 [Svornostia abyssi]|uniref:Uncharacterized protein n=1 Tax=Svornostia abyssi TaxID=2898438 RepID=A0ABY5PB90_9ACTN|nr:hypothetical protein LRS13_13795 [Parviterribacteraceae bacterium J379]